MNTWKITNSYGKSFYRAIDIYQVNEFIRRGFTVVICR